VTDEERTRLERLRKMTLQMVADCDALLSGQCSHPEDKVREMTGMGDKQRSWYCTECTDTWGTAWEKGA
jgi:hypothetical protein